ncbi:hypothetical protein [Truepera radiovictrix]|uniref:Uncharacterized protein n=1 Tax=Truepera radiovictrix (strain DSM 17093 / CIP 108686 / LMG 22925 / RQ-24) TaxID=649638 RepID=D7CTQ7_TRURR|nr:hypothetical protein [Truepera radiovictrix]ADI15604.1 conserved hypothetical protein [Truepera radiovictrix DSM 17093]WMT58767.1 hypothetical protein RCV51_07420 [Truepera radiovictrix]
MTSPRTTAYRALSRRQRRALVLASAAVLAAGVLVALAGVSGLALWALIGCYALGSAGLSWSVGFVDALPDRALDERQQAVRDRAHRAAYPAVSWYVLALLALLGGYPAAFTGPWRMLVAAAGLAALMLPTWIVAWLEPDPTPDEPDALSAERTS